MLAALAAGLLSASSASAQTAENVLLVVNEQSPDSIRVGEHYAQARSIPANHIVHIKIPVSEVVLRSDYETRIEGPIGDAISRNLLQDQILFIVLTKDVPLRVDGTGGLTGTVASVDSELTLLYRKMTGAAVVATGRVDNPYFLGEKPITEARRFTRMDSDLYLVTRLDGFTVDDVLKLIDRGAKPSRDGQIVLDQKATLVDRGGDQWLAETAKRLTDSGQTSRVILESSHALATTTAPVLGYFSWGSNDPANQLRKTGLQFVPGAIGGMFVSTDGRTFHEPSSQWKPAPAGSASGGQTLVGDLIREGITGISASVTEPYLDAIVRPQILFPAYLAGFTLAESYYLATPFISWQNIVIGDPLCAPWLATPLRQEEIHKGIDQDLSLPAIFGQRRLASIQVRDLNRDAIKLQIKGFSLRSQGKPDSEVEAVLNRAVQLEPRLIASLMLMAEMASVRQDHSAAIARYRAVLQAEGNNVSALNNLAYALADKANGAEEALPLAERAYALSGKAWVVADTLGWVRFKLGQFAAAVPLLEGAAAAMPKDVDVQIHAAAINVEIKRPERAKTYLDAAVAANPDAGTREDFKALMARIKVG